MNVYVWDISGSERGVQLWTDTVVRAIDAFYWKEAIVDPPKRKRAQWVEHRVEQFNQMDAIILTELGHRSRDECPAYVEVLMATKTPWTVYTHGLFYSKAQALDSLFASPSFCGKVIVANEAEVAALNHDHGLDLDAHVEPRLPYYPQAKKRVGSGKCLVTTSVTSLDKGVVPVAKAGRDLRLPVEFRGAGVETPWGATSHLVMEQLVKLGFEVIKAGKPRSAEPWLVGGVCYTGGYTQVGQELFTNVSAHASLMSASKCVGHLEYTTLEALDFGVLAVAPNVQRLEDELLSLASIDYEKPSKYDDAALREVLEFLAGQPDNYREKVWRHNRDVLVEQYSPAAYVERVLKVVTG